MASPMVIIRGSLLSQAHAPASLNQAFRPSIGPSTARRGRPAADTQPAQPSQPDVPNLFGRPTPTQVTQAPDPVVPPPPPPPAPAPVAPGPNVMNQALMLQNLLGNLGQSGMSPLFNALGVTEGVSANPAPWWSPTSPGSNPWGQGTGFGGHLSHVAAGAQGGGHLAGTGVGWNPWLFAPEVGDPSTWATSPWGTPVVPELPFWADPMNGAMNWVQMQAPQQMWTVPFQEATQTALGNLGAELQALPAIQALFGAPLSGYGGGGPSWYSASAPNTQGGAIENMYASVNDPMINAAIQALAQYIQTPGGV